MAGMWYLSKHGLSNANISLSMHKSEKITRNRISLLNPPLLKSNSTELMDIGYRSMMHGFVAMPVTRCIKDACSNLSIFN